MTDALEPIAGDAAGPATAATTLSPDGPRLPDAVPSETANPAPVESAPLPEEAAAEPEIPSAPKQSGTPGTFFVLMALIVGAIVVIAAIARPWESAPEEPVTTVEEPAAAVEAPTPTSPDTAPAATIPDTAPATTTATTPATTTTTTVSAVDGAEPAATTTIVVGALP